VHVGDERGSVDPASTTAALRPLARSEPRTVQAGQRVAGAASGHARVPVACVARADQIRGDATHVAKGQLRRVDGRGCRLLCVSSGSGHRPRGFLASHPYRESYYTQATVAPRQR
jgi:hypothetical protein